MARWDFIQSGILSKCPCLFRNCWFQQNTGRVSHMNICSLVLSTELIILAQRLSDKAQKPKAWDSIPLDFLVPRSWQDGKTSFFMKIPLFLKVSDVWAQVVFSNRIFFAETYNCRFCAQCVDWQRDVVLKVSKDIFSWALPLYLGWSQRKSNLVDWAGLNSRPE